MNTHKDWAHWHANKRGAHKIDVAPVGAFDPANRPEAEGRAICGAAIPSRGAFEPSGMAEHCAECNTIERKANQ